MLFTLSQKRITSASVKCDAERLLGDGSVSIDSIVKTVWKPGYAETRALFRSGIGSRERGIEQLHSSLSSHQVLKTSTDKLGQLIEAGLERITTDLHKKNSSDGQRNLVDDYSRALQQRKELSGSKDGKAQRRLFYQLDGLDASTSTLMLYEPQEVTDGHEDEDDDDGVGDDERLENKRPRRVLKLKFGKNQYCTAVHFKHEAMFNI